MKTNDSTFEKDVLQSKIPVLVDFWAPWCGPCVMLSPILETLEKQLAGKVKVVKLNVDENPQTASKYRITGIPTVITFKNGKPDKVLVGVRHEQAYIDALDLD